MDRIWLSPPHMGPEERALLLDAFDSNWIAPLGPHVDGFESEMVAYLGGGHAAALSSGTGALHLALVILGIGAGDEVLTSTLTFAATVNAIRYVGASPVFIDSDATWTMDPHLLEAELRQARAEGRPVKAALVVDLYGQCADYDAIRAICDRYEVALLEDAAESLGASYKGRAAGTLGDLAALSFNGNKIITTSGGGMLLTPREEWAARARYLATQARDPAPHYQHSVLGYNYRMSNLLAAVGRGQLRVLPQRVARRRAIYARYVEALGDLPGVAFMPQASYGEPNCWLSCLTLDPQALGADTTAVREALGAHNIEARPVWKPMHLQPVFAGERARLSGVSDALFASGLCLPSGSSLTQADQGRVIAAFRAAVGR